MRPETDARSAEETRQVRPRRLTPACSVSVRKGRLAVAMAAALFMAAWRWLKCIEASCALTWEPEPPGGISRVGIDTAAASGVTAGHSLKANAHVVVTRA